jgi:exodeoxyribonuclease VIII
MSTSDPLRWSALRHMMRSPAHCRYYIEHGLEPTPAMKLGTLVHSIVLGATHKYVIWEGARRGKEWTEFRDAHTEDIVTRDEFDRAYEIAHAVTTHPGARPYLRGIKEQTLNWEIAGRACTGTPDLRLKDIISDLKITADARPEKMQWHALKMGWLAQAAWYMNAAATIGDPCGAAVIVAVEPKPPFPVVIYELTARALVQGTKQWRLAFERYRICEDANDWPGYASCVQPLDTPDDDELILTIDGEEVAA